MKKPVYGVGVNDKTRPAWVDGKPVKEYDLWQSMLKRCFSEKYQHAIQPIKVVMFLITSLITHSFTIGVRTKLGFGKVDEKGRSWCLDKDLLFVGNKIYSETACVFVPNEINSFFNEHGNARGEYPVGVSFHKRVGRFVAQCTVNGKPQHLGLFNTPEEAFVVYKPFKENLCKQLALKCQSEIDQRLFNAMMNWQIHQTEEVNYE